MKPLNKIGSAIRRALFGAGFAATVLAIVSGSNTFAGAFTQGNIVVERLGDSTETLAASGNAIYFDELTTGGAPVQTIVVPDSGSTSLIDDGATSVCGGVTLSADGKSLVFPGYNTAYPYASSIASATSAAVPRGVGRLDLNGNYTLGGTTTVAFSGSTIRGAASDGTNNFWGAGTASSTTTNAGAFYFGTAATPFDLISGNFRCLGSYNGSLWYSTASSTALSYGIFEFPGYPTAGGTPTNVIRLTAADSAYNFSVSPDGKTVYYADDGAENATNAGIKKWVQTAGTWSKAYQIISNTPCFGLLVDWGKLPPVIYATTGSGVAGNNLLQLTDNGSASPATVLATAPSTAMYRGIVFSPNSGTPPAAPTITSVSPANAAANAGNSVTFTLNGTTGYPAASNFWYKISGSTTNLVAGATGPTLTFTNLSSTNTGSYFAILSNASGSATSSVVSLSINSGPIISGISPASITNNAGQTVAFALTASLGSPAANVFWYQTVGSTTTLVAGATNTTLTLTNVTGANSGNYFAVLTNASGSATSSVASFTVIDPVLETEPASAVGLVDGQVQFTVTVAGSSPGYQWYFSDINGNIIAPAVSLGDASIISGANTRTLTVANLQPGDVTNFVVIATTVYGAVTSSVASLISGPNFTPPLPIAGALLAFWDFDGPQFTNTAVNPNSLNNPAPFIGSGTASAAGTTYDPGTSPFSGVTDPFDVGLDVDNGEYVFTPYGFEQPSPNFAWGTDNYPASGGNKQNGVQFNVSTVGAKNIIINYDSRVSATASDYERLQYTTNGTTWIDYPASSTFDGLSSGTGANSGYNNFNYSLIGFTGVDNNPNFGFRVVTEFPSTASYGVNSSTNYVGTSNTYGTGGTVTYDLVAVLGDAITNNDTPPALSFASSFGNTNFASTNMADNSILKLNFTASSAQMAASNLTFSVQTVNTVSAGTFNQPLAPTFTVTNTSSTNFQLSIAFGSGIPDPVDAAPIMVTATDTNGESTAAWFVLTVSSINQPPTNTLTSLSATNTLVNVPLTIPFVAGSSRNPYASLTYTVTTDNNTVVPYGNIMVAGGTTNGNSTVTITPAANAVGNALVTVTVNDNDPVEPRSTTANIAFVVRPNTNSVAVDYFNYDSLGSLDAVATNYWRHLSGGQGQLKVESAPVGGVAVVDSSDYTENLQATLAGSPYSTNSGTVLYAGFTVNMDPTRMPSVNGSYFTAFNDGSGTTADVEGLLVAATNGVATAGDYRLGIANVVGATSATAQMFPQDLTPGQTYFVVISLALANGHSTLWVSPTNQASPSVTDTTATTLYNIADFEFRESGATDGSASVGGLNVGLSFNSVFYPAQANPASFTVGENSTNELSVLTNDAGWDLSLTSVTPDTNATATIAGSNITFVPTANFTGVSTVGYTITDNLGNTSSATISVTVTNVASITPIPVSAQYSSANGGSMVLSWSNPAFGLQTTTNLLSPWTTLPGAASPYTSIIGTNAARFYRLVH